VVDGDEYKYFIAGTGSQGPKRDPYARELTVNPPYPVCNCIVRDTNSYPWHDAGWQAPRFRDLIIYQFHVGTFTGPDRENRVAKFLDVLDRLDYLADLGVTAIEPLPITEFASPRSLGYDGSDLYSPEMDYQVDAASIDTYLPRINALLARRGQPPLTQQQLSIPINQLKVLVDLCHLWGMAVLFDVVYNHAGFQIGGQDESLWFFDRFRGTSNNDSLYFTDRSHTGPVFAIWQDEVRQFLIDNARFFVEEYHIDGLRYDQVSVIVEENRNNGWRFCQDLTNTVRAADSTAIQIAEYWSVDPYVVRSVPEGGAGFDATWHDGLRTTIRAAIGQASGGVNAGVNLDAIASNLYPPGFPAGWKAVQYVESHDEVYRGRNQRIAQLAGGSDARSWYASSRSRVATGLVLTAPGIPMLFMGQEFLENKQWSDNPSLIGER
jgi:1,4-alpha-glucan branching enzyme